jgi:hypothetical protein
MRLDMRYQRRLDLCKIFGMFPRLLLSGYRINNRPEVIGNYIHPFWFDERVGLYESLRIERVLIADRGRTELHTGKTSAAI